MATSQIASLDIVSATYGGINVTSWVQKEFQKFLDVTGAAAAVVTTWSFVADKTFFGLDPNPGIPKVAVVTYRYSLDNASGFSPFQSVAAREGGIIEISPAGPTLPTYQWPSPTKSNEFIIAAYWADKDVTSVVQSTWVQQTADPDLVNGTDITVSSAALGPDPWLFTPKQFTVVFARYVNNQWYPTTCVDLQAPDSWKLTIPPAIPAIINRRVNIYSAVYGGQDYTAYLRQRYISDTIGITQSPGGVINDSQNVWCFSDYAYLGPDPLPNERKALTIIYRVAALTGVKTGYVTDPQAPPCWTQQWYDEKPSDLSTDKYPLLNDFSGFHVASVSEGDKLMIDLATDDLTPLSMPRYEAKAAPWFEAAVYDTVNLQSFKNFKLYWGSNTFGISPDTFGIPDPAPGTRKQFVALVAYPRDDQPGFEVRTTIALDGTDAQAKITSVTPDFNKQAPTPYAPPLVRKVKFTCQAPVYAWPKVWKNGKQQWDPRPKGVEVLTGGGLGDWGMMIYTTVEVDLIDDAHCKEGEVVRFNFDVETFNDTPQTQEYLVSADPTKTLGLVLPFTRKETDIVYYTLRGLQFLGELVGLILEAFE